MNIHELENEKLKKENAELKAKSAKRNAEQRMHPYKDGNGGRGGRGGG